MNVVTELLLLFALIHYLAISNELMIVIIALFVISKVVLYILIKILKEEVTIIRKEMKK